MVPIWYFWEWYCHDSLHHLTASYSLTVIILINCSCFIVVTVCSLLPLGFFSYCVLRRFFIHLLSLLYLNSVLELCDSGLVPVSEAPVSSSTSSQIFTLYVSVPKMYPVLPHLLPLPFFPVTTLTPTTLFFAKFLHYREKDVFVLWLPGVLILLLVMWLIRIIIMCSIWLWQ